MAQTAKNTNLRRHGISFDEAKHIFDGPVLTRVDDREEHGEVRENSLGMLSPEAPLMVVHTARGGKTRLISAREANCQKRKIYYQTRINAILRSYMQTHKAGR